MNIMNSMIILAQSLICCRISFRDTSAEVNKYSQNANDEAQDLLNSNNETEILDEMD